MRRSSLALAAIGALAFASCSGFRLTSIGFDCRPGTEPQCDRGLCLELVSFWVGHESFGVWLDAPPATRLLNAKLTAHDAPPCRGENAVAWVNLDGSVVRAGPIDVGGAHGLVLGFPSSAWWGHWGRATYLDVELDVAGTPRCVRTPLTNAAGQLDEAP